MTALIIYISTFCLVFALGFQSLNVNNGHYKAAFMTSLAIGVSNLVLYKTVPDANWLEITAYLVAGPCAIVASMYCHARFMRRKSDVGQLQKPGKVPLPAGKQWPEPPSHNETSS